MSIERHPKINKMDPDLKFTEEQLSAIHKIGKALLDTNNNTTYVPRGFTKTDMRIRLLMLINAGLRDMLFNGHFDRHEIEELKDITCLLR